MSLVAAQGGVASAPDALKTAVCEALASICKRNASNATAAGVDGVRSVTAVYVFV